MKIGLRISQQGDVPGTSDAAQDTRPHRAERTIEDRDRLQQVAFNTKETRCSMYACVATASKGLEHESLTSKYGKCSGIPAIHGDVCGQSSGRCEQPRRFPLITSVRTTSKTHVLECIANV